jgi:hypothetical protein
MNIFKQPYTLRRYKSQQWVKGYARSEYEDSTFMLDVQPAGDSVEVNTDGRRVARRLTVYSDSPIKTEDQEKGTKADRILVDGTWYTCTSCAKWRNTILAHYECSFAAVPETETPR